MYNITFFKFRIGHINLHVIVVTWLAWCVLWFIKVNIYFVFIQDMLVSVDPPALKEFKSDVIFFFYVKTKEVIYLCYLVHFFVRCSCSQTFSWSFGQNYLPLLTFELRPPLVPTPMCQLIYGCHINVFPFIWL